MYFEFEAKHEWRTWFLLSVSATVRLCVQIWIRLDLPLMNWTSTCEYLEVSNVFVWYKANGSVGLAEFLFMNVFVTFVICSWLLLICYLLLPLAALGNFKILIWGVTIYILESKKVNWRVKVFLTWNMHNHYLWSKCACIQIYSEWGYKKLITKNILPKIWSDYWDLRIIWSDYWWWI